MNASLWDEAEELPRPLTRTSLKGRVRLATGQADCGGGTKGCGNCSIIEIGENGGIGRVLAMPVKAAGLATTVEQSPVI